MELLSHPTFRVKNSEILSVKMIKGRDLKKVGKDEVLQLDLSCHWDPQETSNDVAEVEVRLPTANVLKRDLPYVSFRFQKQCEESRLSLREQLVALWAAGVVLLLCMLGVWYQGVREKRNAPVGSNVDFRGEVRMHAA